MLGFALLTPTYGLPDAAPLPLHETPSVLIAAAPKAQVHQAVRRMTYGVCNFTSKNERYDAMYSSAGSGLILGSSIYMRDFLSASMREKVSSEKGGSGSVYYLEWNWFLEWEDNLKVTEIRSPRNGTLMIGKSANTSYLPNKGFVGKDRVDLLVEGKDDSGRPIALTLRYYINVLNDEDYEKIFDLYGENEGAYARALRKYCGLNNDKGYWRISEADGTGDLSTLLSSAASAFTGFADLPGTARVGWGEPKANPNIQAAKAFSNPQAISRSRM